MSAYYGLLGTAVPLFVLVGASRLPRSASLTLGTCLPSLARPTRSSNSFLVSSRCYFASLVRPGLSSSLLDPTRSLSVATKDADLYVPRFSLVTPPSLARRLRLPSLDSLSPHAPTNFPRTLVPRVPLPLSNMLANASLRSYLATLDSHLTYCRPVRPRKP